MARELVGTVHLAQLEFPVAGREETLLDSLFGRQVLIHNAYAAALVIDHVRSPLSLEHTRELFLGQCLRHAFRGSLLFWGGALFSLQVVVHLVLITVELPLSLVIDTQGPLFQRILRFLVRQVLLGALLQSLFVVVDLFFYLLVQQLDVLDIMRRREVPVRSRFC